MATNHTCDYCKKQIDDVKVWGLAVTIDNKGTGPKYDLHKDCLAKLEEIIKKGP